MNPGCRAQNQLNREGNELRLSAQDQLNGEGNEHMEMMEVVWLKTNSVPMNQTRRT